MMDWLNNHAPAIQAIAAVLSFVIAGILVWATSRYVSLTAKYVELTRQMLETSQLQIAKERHRELGKIPKLLGVIQLIQAALDRLPYTASDANVIPGASLWTEGDLGKFHELASDVSSSAGLIATSALKSLRWIQTQVANVTSVNPSMGVDWSRFPWDQWQTELLEAHKLTSQVWRTAHQVADAKMTMAKDTHASA